MMNELQYLSLILENNFFDLLSWKKTCLKCRHVFMVLVSGSVSVSQSRSQSILLLTDVFMLLSHGRGGREVIKHKNMTI